MQVTFYKNSSVKNCANKKLVKIKDINLDMIDDKDILYPSFTIAINQIETIDSFNMVYIDTFHRYYFIQKITKEKGGVYRIYCKCDVLQSHFNKISQSTAIIKRQESIVNTYLQDGNMKFDSRNKIRYRLFPNGLEHDNYYYLNIGG